MTRVTVIVFILESFPGFEIILNSTLQSMLSNNSVKNFDKREPHISDLIWQNINKDCNSALIPHHFEKSSKKIDVTQERHKTTVVNMIQDRMFHEQSLYSDDETRNNDNNIDTDNYPKDAPYLVAIFETMNNLTAQTCGGTLLSTHWVVLPAVCLDVLSSYNYLNETEDSTRNSHYSIVANANNPVVDGTVHNVTEIILNSSYQTGIQKHPNETPGPFSIALMKIKPAVVKSEHIVYKDLIKKGVSVRVYGWTLKEVNQNSTGQDVMTVSFITAKTVDSNICNLKDKYNIINSDPAICLEQSNKIQVNRMNSGGPVLIFSENMFYLLGVAQFYEAPNFVVLPLAAHFDWISEIIKN